MIKCPNCNQSIDADSFFCDQCGKELMYCPDCGKPKKGIQCPACGEDLVSASQYLSKDTSKTIIPPDAPAVSSKPAATIVKKTVADSSKLYFVGRGWKLEIKEGGFGRTSGIYSEFAQIDYISGHHGEIRKVGPKWQVRDIGSTNGTSINGVDMIPDKWYELNPGDTVSIATVDFKIER